MPLCPPVVLLNSVGGQGPGGFVAGRLPDEKNERKSKYKQAKQGTNMRTPDRAVYPLLKKPSTGKKKKYIRVNFVVMSQCRPSWTGVWIAARPLEDDVSKDASFVTLQAPPPQPAKQENVFTAAGTRCLPTHRCSFLYLLMVSLPMPSNIPGRAGRP